MGIYRYICLPYIYMPQDKDVLHHYRYMAQDAVTFSGTTQDDLCPSGTVHE